MKIPTRTQAGDFILEAQALNPGPWVQHSLFVAQAAETIAQYHSSLDPEAAFVMGYLHDIGRRAGKYGMRHMTDGYYYLEAKGFDDAARICITHAYVIKELFSVSGERDCSGQEMEFLKGYLSSLEFDDYDRLIQLCDTISMPTGFCLAEKRLVDVALRYGVNEYCVQRWKAYLGIQKDFERAIGRSIYAVLPGVIENTFDIQSNRQ
jgi:putative nucleotidyltransferase with HDIG domain